MKAKIIFEKRGHKFGRKGSAVECVQKKTKLEDKNENLFF